MGCVVRRPLTVSSAKSRRANHRRESDLGQLNSSLISVWGSSSKSIVSSHWDRHSIACRARLGRDRMVRFPPVGPARDSVAATTPVHFRNRFRCFLEDNWADEGTTDGSTVDIQGSGSQSFPHMLKMLGIELRKHTAGNGRLLDCEGPASAQSLTI